MNPTSKGRHWLALAVAILLCPQVQANSAEPGGFVTQSEGNITYRADTGKERPLPAFAKVTGGTHIRLGDNAKLQIIYLRNARQEAWSGKGLIEVGDDEGKSIAPGMAPPTVKALQPYVVETLVKSHAVMEGINARQGMIRVRSLLIAAKIKEAEDRYAALRAQAADDDITPEIFLLTALDGLRAYQSMKKALDEMLLRQPANDEARALRDHFMLLLDTGTAESPTGESVGK
jgi:hypothetical protein